MKYFFLLITLFIFSSSCTTSSVTPTRNSRQAIDSIFQHQSLFLQAQLDSMCVKVREEYFQVTVDSIMNARKSEMNNLVK